MADKHHDFSKMDSETRGELLSMSSRDREAYLADIARESALIAAQAAVEHLEKLDAEGEKPKGMVAKIVDKVKKSAPTEEDQGA